jgi:hypothetical protein
LCSDPTLNCFGHAVFSDQVQSELNLPLSLINCSMAIILPPKFHRDISGQPENTIVGQPSKPNSYFSPFLIKGRSRGSQKFQLQCRISDGITVAIGVPSSIVSAYTSFKARLITVLSSLDIVHAITYAVICILIFNLFT